MMTARSEYRLLLRQDNADARLTPRGYEVGLINETRYNQYLNKYRLINEEIARLQRTSLAPSDELNRFLTGKGQGEITTGIRISELIKRPYIEYDDLKFTDAERPPLPPDVRQQVNIMIKYKGYIDKQLAQVEQFRRLETRIMPQDIDYNKIYGLRLEARQKLSDIRPKSLGQASRISGVSAADIAVLMLYLRY